MDDLHIAFGHHFTEVAQTEFVGDIPLDTQDDNCTVKMAPFKERGRVLAERVHTSALAWPRTVCTRTQLGSRDPHKVSELD